MCVDCSGLYMVECDNNTFCKAFPTRARLYGNHTMVPNRSFLYGAYQNLQLPKMLFDPTKLLKFAFKKSFDFLHPPTTPHTRVAAPACSGRPYPRVADRIPILLGLRVPTRGWACGIVAGWGSCPVPCP